MIAKPLGNRVIAQLIEHDNEVVKDGILIPDSAKEKPQEYIIISLGTGGLDINGNDIAFEVKSGDRVITAKYGGTDIKIDGNEYKILSCHDILAILE
jgi:chaperonin GroES